MEMDKDEIIAAVAAGQSLAEITLVPGSDYTDLSLRRIDLRRADFSGTDLTGCRFVGCNLTDAYLQGTNLRNVCFEASTLTGVNLLEAIITGTDFSGAAGIIDAGIDWRGYRFIGVKHASGWMIKAGCRWFTEEAAIQHWTYRENDDALQRVALICGRALPIEWRHHDRTFAILCNAEDGGDRVLVTSRIFDTHAQAATYIAANIQPERFPAIVELSANI